MTKHIVIAAFFVAATGAAQADDVKSIWDVRASLAPQTDPVYEAAQTRSPKWSPAVDWDTRSLLTGNVNSRQETTWSGRI